MVDTALITVCDDAFMPGLRVAWRSLVETNPWFPRMTIPFIVLDAGLSYEHKAEIGRLYDYAQVRAIDQRAYRKVRLDGTDERLRKAFYKLEIFKPMGFKRLVFLDMDTLVRGDISELFYCEAPVSGCQCYLANRDDMTSEINTGVLVVTEAAINRETYGALLALCEQRTFSLGDQGAINAHFGAGIRVLPKVYNAEKRMQGTRNCTAIWAGAKIIHFVGSKPWQTEKPNSRERSYAALEDLWRRYA